MVSVEDSYSNSSRFSGRFSRQYYTPPSTRIHRPLGRSMRTIRSNFFQSDQSCSSSFVVGSIAENSVCLSENLTDSVVDLRLGELACRNHNSVKSTSDDEVFLDISQAFSDFSACSSDISGELQRLATVPNLENEDSRVKTETETEPERCLGFLQREGFSLSSEIIESISPEDLQQTVEICVDELQSLSVAVKRSAAAKLRFLAKNRSDNRAVIGESGAVPALITLLRCSDALTQEHVVTALLNLSLHEENKPLISHAGSIKSLIYVLKTGTETSKQNAACALLSLALVDDNKISIGACGAIPPLVSLLINGSNRGKKDALTTLYKLCSVKVNKERAVSAGTVKPLVELVSERGTGLAEKAMVVLSSLAVVEEGKVAMVAEGGIPVLVEAIEDVSMKGKEFAVLTLLQLCVDCGKNRGLLVREGAIPPLVSLSQSGTARAKHKAETLLGYLREARQEAASTSTT